MRKLGVFAVIGLLGCGSVSSDPDASGGDDAPGDGASGVDAITGRCSPTAAFQAPTLVAGINTSLDETGLSLTRDELIAFVGRTNTGVAQTLKMATRPTITASFSAAGEDPLLAAINNVAGDEYGATVSSDGLILYFHRQAMNIGIHVSTRSGPMQPFGASTFVSVDGPALLDALTPHLSADGQTLYWLDFAVFALHSATRGATPSVFAGERAASTIDNVYNPVLSADELTLYSSNGFGTDILAATRADRNSAFGTGVPVGGVNSPDMDWPVYLTVDGCILYLASSRPGGLGGTDIWEARRGP